MDKHTWNDLVNLAGYCSGFITLIGVALIWGWIQAAVYHVLYAMGGRSGGNPQGIGFRYPGYFTFWCTFLPFAAIDTFGALWVGSTLGWPWFAWGMFLSMWVMAAIELDW
jgi:hypothetical protein